MSHISVYLRLSSEVQSKKAKTLTLIKKSMKRVSEGRYFIVVFDSPTDWASHIPIEGYVVSSTLGSAQNRNFDWEFFGNGAIRVYEGEGLTYLKTLQWIVVRRIGDKPYKRRQNLSKTFHALNEIPVSDKAFTRDVANNVWHLKSHNFELSLISRFSRLLTWLDEDFLVVTESGEELIQERKKLNLKQDLIGVPKKIPYYWNSGNKLF